jgi:uncharacterized protein DUF5994
MTSLSRPSPPPSPPLGGAARIRFRQPVSNIGVVDAAWWPRSGELLVEPPALFDMLSTACRDVACVGYNQPFWEPVPRRMRVDDRVVRLRGYRRKDPALLTVSDSSGREHIDILVVAPEADADFAERVLHLAGGVGSLEPPSRILERTAEPASSGPT